MGVLISRVERRFEKTVTFTATGDGAVGTVTLATVTGAVRLDYMSARCTTLLASSGATLTLDVGSSVGALIASTTATAIDANEFWADATPELEVSTAINNQNIVGNIILSVGSATITAGVIEFVFYWTALSDNGNLA